MSSIQRQLGGAIRQARAEVFPCNRDSEELHDQLGTARRPLNALAEQELCPGSKFLDSINAGLR